MTLIKGADISSIIYQEYNGAKYIYNGKQDDIFNILKDNGFNLIRIRLWNDPFSSDGKPYTDAPTDYHNYVKIASRAKKMGFKTMLCLHYSDAWVDPGKQVPPKKWMNLDLDSLTKEIYSYTKNVLLSLKELALLPDYVAVGNEITNGLLWPIGKIPNFKNISLLVNSGLQAVEDVSKDIKTMIHLDNGGNVKMYQNWFESYFKEGGKDFDIIGLSYYPLWHGHLSDLKANLENLTDLYNKEMMIVETSYPFTTKDYPEYENLKLEERKGSPLNEEIIKKCEYEISIKGQCEYTKDFIELLKSFENCLGFIWWEPDLIPVPNSSWATWEGIEYMHEKGPLGNEWANQCLFDFDGNALETLNIIKNA